MVWKGYGKADQKEGQIMNKSNDNAAVVHVIIAAALFFGVICFVGPLLVVAGVVLIYAVIAGMIAGGIMLGLQSMVHAIKDNRDPYADYVDRMPEKYRQKNARKAYCFGPCFHQIFNIIKSVWTSLADMKAKAEKFVQSKRTDVLTSEWMQRHRRTQSFIQILLWTLQGLSLATIYGINGAGNFMAIVLFAAIMSAVMILSTAAIFVLWAVDRGYLYVKRIFSSCPYCMKPHRVPVFICPSCGAEHTRLVPGPYGILTRKCRCGQELPTTFLAGRDRKMRAKCPSCNTILPASASRHFSAVLVGSSASGKTALITAFYHLFMERLQSNPGVRATVPESYQSLFEKVESRYQGEERIEHTAVEETAEIYPVLIDKSGQNHKIEIPFQFSLYDIAGEVLDDFTKLTAMLPQRQMTDSDGIIVVLDPFADEQSIQAIENFTAYVKSVLTHGRRGTRISRPVSVVLTRIDKAEIMASLSKAFETEKKSKLNVEELRDAAVMDVLERYGKGDIIRTLEANFCQIHYFPVSATGGVEYSQGECRPLEPDGVMAPFENLIQESGHLAELIG